MSWLAKELGVSRNGLYRILAGDYHNVEVEEALSEMFPALPPWRDTSGAVPIREIISIRTTSRRS